MNDIIIDIYTKQLMDLVWEIFEKNEENFHSEFEKYKFFMNLTLDFCAKNILFLDKDFSLINEKSHVEIFVKKLLMLLENYNEQYKKNQELNDDKK